jgi:hypothetical protein
MGDNQTPRYPVIWLMPACSGTSGKCERLWCEENLGPCKDCGLPWVKYVLAPEETDINES